MGTPKNIYYDFLNGKNDTPIGYMRDASERISYINMATKVNQQVIEAVKKAQDSFFFNNTD